MVACAQMWDEFIETFELQLRSASAATRFSSRDVPVHYWQVFQRRVVSAVVWMSSLGFAWWFMFSDDAQRKDLHTISVMAPLALLTTFAVILCVERQRCRRRRQ